jgi:hypothetical protein
MVTKGYPVEGFDMKFSWNTEWVGLFDKQISLIKDDIYRAKDQGKMVVYLSCPLSSRGGGYSGTNVEISEFTRMRLMKEWGTGFWILNPANYQMESKGGKGLMHRHAKELWRNEKDKNGHVIGDLGSEEKLKKLTPAKDGDYMRMWTKILVEDDEIEDKKNLGYHFDGFYFLSPSDVRAFFLNSDTGDLTSSIQNYFSRKFAFDSEFRDFFSIEGLDWDNKNDKNNTSATNSEVRQNLLKQWDRKRLDFFKFYSLKASVNFSSGSHDEWNIWQLLNKKRVEYYDNREDRKNGIGDLIPGFFESKQLNPADFMVRTMKGYEVP